MAYCHASLIDLPNFIRIGETFCGRTDIGTNIKAGFIRSTRFAAGEGEGREGKEGKIKESGRDGEGEGKGEDGEGRK